jgi:hypothetical protein
MKSESEFNLYYSHNVISHYALLDQLRIKANHRKVLVIAALILITIAFGFFAMYATLYPAIKWSIIIFYLGSVGAIYKYEVKDFTRKYEEQFNTDLLGGMVHYVAPGFIYDAHKYIPEAGFCLSEIYGEEAREYNASDYVEGFIGDTHLKFCQVEAIMDRADFTGIYIMSGFQPEVKNHIFIITNIAYSDNKHTNQRLHNNRPPVIKTGNIEFDDKFSIYGKDTDEVQRIITPDLQRRIIAYSRKSGREINISIYRNNLFMTICTEPLLFEANYNAEPDKKTIQSWFKYLNDAYDVVNDLRL